MPSESPHPAHAAYRLTVTLGLLAVGAMAAWLYGPPPERVAAWIDSFAPVPGETPQRDTGITAIEAATQAPSRSEPLSDAPLVAPRPLNGHGETRRVTDDSAADLLAEMADEGAESPRVEPWGFGPDRVYRAAARFTTRSGSQRSLDAFGETRRDASAALLAQWRATRR